MNFWEIFFLLFTCAAAWRNKDAYIKGLFYTSYAIIVIQTTALKQNSSLDLYDTADL